MRIPLHLSLLACGAACLLSACAPMLGRDDPARQQLTVSVVNSLSWTNPLSGKRDGARTSWPLLSPGGAHEQFPLAQLRQCQPDGSCAWGVMRAERSIDGISYGPSGVALDVTLVQDVARRQEVHQAEMNAAMAIPSDVAALQSQRPWHQHLQLQYGQVRHVVLELGVAYDICVRRIDAAGQVLDACDIPFI
ncbi:hypothetical protein [Rugamonas sp.]|uniref:hypothetical protein n=1 Tax=Rugamonas sp. TaxID=1926287 RepID=UPI0025FCA3D7|nr:hypothetical protein [Rugamonas sp.]